MVEIELDTLTAMWFMLGLLFGLFLSLVTDR
mgnify:CR=1 FL=1